MSVASQCRKIQSKMVPVMFVVGLKHQVHCFSSTMSSLDHRIMSFLIPTLSILPSKTSST